MNRPVPLVALLLAAFPVACEEIDTPDPPSVRAEPSAPDPIEAHRIALLKKVPSGFTVVHQKPFFVIGDEPETTVRRRARDTVRWAVDKLQKEYFPKDPGVILDIWLFRDKESYEKHALDLFGERPHTPFGYYSEAHGALVMNIATGGGTLVHEIVHPFMAANFPECPTWLNEGLASLYEQCSDKEGRIRGLVNWRLAGLQSAIRAQTLPTFRELTSTTSFEFYRKDRGTNYAQARYLCYYLQEKGLLRRFYSEFRKGVAGDPTGFETLKKVLGVDDMAKFQESWEAFVLGLRAP